MNEDVKLTDFHRIFIGTAPPEFLLEVFGRTVIVYVIFFLVMRLLGKRMNGQLTVTETVLILTLGAIISVPMQAVDKGLIQGIVVLIIAFFIQRIISWLGVKNAGFQKFSLGETKLLVKNGILQMDELKKNRLSQEIVFSKLRTEEIFNLGEVKRLYIEAAGLFSIYKEVEKRPGLSTLPQLDSKILKAQKRAEGYKCCLLCGQISKDEHEHNCPNCKSDRWTEAVI